MYSTLVSSVVLPLLGGLAPQGTARPLTPPAPPAPPHATWVDVNGDGHLDLYASEPSAGDRLLLFAGDLGFEDRTARSGLGTRVGSRSADFADADLDRASDLLRVTAEGRVELWQNLGGGLFTDRTVEAGLAQLDAAADARWVDLDGDELRDVIVRTAGGPLLLQNQGGTFLPLGPARVAQGVSGGTTGVPAPAPAPAPAPVTGSPRAGSPAADRPPTGPGSGRAASAGLSGGSTSAAPAGTQSQAMIEPVCSTGVVDAATGFCLPASSIPTTGALYPLGPELDITPTGRVIAGTALGIGGNPTEALHVYGQAVIEDTLRLTDDVELSGGGGFFVVDAASEIELRSFGSMFMLSDNVGVNTSTPNPSTTLDVNGSIRAASLSLADGDVSLDDDGSSGLEVFADGDITLNSASDVRIPPSTMIGGTSAPSHRLTVQSNNQETVRLIGPGGFGSTARLNFGDADYVFIEEDFDDHLRISSSRGTELDRGGSPVTAVTFKATNDTNGASAGAAVWAENFGTGDSRALVATGWGTGVAAQINNRSSGSHIACSAGAGINVFEVLNSGRVVTTAVQITGGGDLVEGFKTGEEECPPGTVVTIDPETPGELRPSWSAYDPRVAGVVSGAGGVNHGIRMGQDGVLDGETLVAMAGRVYVRCSAENGAVVPGDLLTTAGTPGHAMKATDRDKSFGAVIGKAMSTLDEGTGLVMVLVNLQ